MDCRRKERREKHVVGRVGLNGLFSQEKKRAGRQSNIDENTAQKSQPE